MLRRHPGGCPGCLATLDGRKRIPQSASSAIRRADTTRKPVSGGRQHDALPRAWSSVNYWRCLNCCAENGFDRIWCTSGQRSHSRRSEAKCQLLIRDSESSLATKSQSPIKMVTGRAFVPAERMQSSVMGNVFSGIIFDPSGFHRRVRFLPSHWRNWRQWIRLQKGLTAWEQNRRLAISTR